MQNQRPTHSDSVLLRKFVEEYEQGRESTQKPKEPIKAQHPKRATQ